MNKALEAITIISKVAECGRKLEQWQRFYLFDFHVDGLVNVHIFLMNPLKFLF